ncbi:hypothetical protein JTB14_004854 [Gonioctena quinquepunctata]|nr:hypothetical protein JTB14_004854 [Gonioctena quinquepunctata]
METAETYGESYIGKRKILLLLLFRNFHISAVPFSNHSPSKKWTERDNSPGRNEYEILEPVHLLSRARQRRSNGIGQARGRRNKLKVLGADPDEKPQAGEVRLVIQRHDVENRAQHKTDIYELKNGGVGFYFRVGEWVYN